jgi:hypothetical protein
MSTVVGSQYAGATAVDADSLIAQLDSQGKLTMPRCKNKKKIDTKIKFQKQTNMLRMDKSFRSINCYQKTYAYVQISIPLNLQFTFY